MSLNPTTTFAARAAASGRATASGRTTASGRSTASGRTRAGGSAINDLGANTYSGLAGGLYPGSLNYPPTTYLNFGLNTQVPLVIPRNAAGASDPTNGKIGLAFLGMSNWAIMIDGANGNQTGFTNGYDTVAKDSTLNSKVVYCMAAQFGNASKEWAGLVGGTNPWGSGWTTALTAASLTAQQIQVAFCFCADIQWSANAPFSAEYLTHAGYLETWWRLLKTTCPNCVLAFFSALNHTYFCFDPAVLSPTLQCPNASYEASFALQTAIADMVSSPIAKNVIYNPSDGTVVAPQVFWHTVLWGPPDQPRSDGFVMTSKMVRSAASGYSGSHADAVHPSGGAAGDGVETWVPMLVAYTDTDPLWTPWYKKDGTAGSGSNAPTVVITANGVTLPATISLARDSIIAFTAAGTPTDGGSISRYSWNFGDGCCGQTQNPTKRYPVAGSYTARLAVVSSNGNYSITSIPISVT